MDLIKIASTIAHITQVDAVRDGEERLVFGIDDKKIGYLDAYGEVQEILGDFPENLLIKKEEDRSTESKNEIIVEWTLSIPTSTETPLLIKFIDLVVDSNNPTSETINFIDEFSSYPRFILGSLKTNNPVSGLMVTSQSKSSFTIDYNGGSGTEVFTILAIGE